MTRYTVRFSEESWATVQAQATYIAVEQKSPLNSARWLARVVGALETLELMPHRFAVDQRESADLGCEVRRLVFERTYMFFYSIDDLQERDTVVIFRHGARRGPWTPRRTCARSPCEFHDPC